MKAPEAGPDNATPVRILQTKLFIPRTHPDVAQRTWLDQKPPTLSGDGPALTGDPPPNHSPG
jgi:hypothetical protein